MSTVLIPKAGKESAAPLFYENPDAEHHRSARRIIGVLGGKSGAGTTLVTALLSISMNRIGYQCGILSTHGTSLCAAQMFGLEEKAHPQNGRYLPVRSKTGISILTPNMLPDTGTGEMPADALWENTLWPDLDYLFVDLPPQADAHTRLTFCRIPIDRMVLVTSPQWPLFLSAGAALKTAVEMGVPVLGIIENMSHLVCPDSGKPHKVFGDSGIEAYAAEHDLPIFARIPIDPVLAGACRQGNIEMYTGKTLFPAAKALEDVPPRR